jgi:two-component system, cell cycle sensor histidine kinase and response regulator CckA
VEQMLQALATRAWSSMPDGGRLQIRASRGSFDQRHLRETGWGDPGDYGVITVKDTGVGMSPATVSRLFQPFFTPEDWGEDSALNVSMVYGLMKQHRGFIEVESDPGTGTTVRLYFRLARSESPAVEEDVEEFQPSGTETILFVEDDASLRRVAGRVLRAHGFQVLEADHGLQALELIRAEGMPDLLVTDLVMPSMSGLELIDHLAAEEDLPAILMTSGYRPEFLARGEGRMPDHPFLEKPWTVETLVANVQRILRERNAGRGRET